MGRMSAISLARRRADLETRWREVLERLTALSVAYHETRAVRLGRLTESAGPVATSPGMEHGDQAAWRLARRVAAERQLLAEIEAALDRIARGRYGRCEQCRQQISARLLGARPEARFCSSCSSQAANQPAYA